ncbi:hypothetical protein NHN26_06125 [Rhodovulum tesquicola]|jgi:hypothetical protein|uniref:Uncharacterized protein n=1 Tax=Rhodovulum steppense TaxID=540251 RepID=A0A4R1Z1P6_9RHOB|nr:MULTISPECIES: hypothetical protein [Rhodovulum]MCO8144800.1 hypothetical protein [Rhodovulum tesquicola]TCM87508.1 hypothetical protein EV216_10261 [Rhodovulum steppense]
MFDLDELSRWDAALKALSHHEKPEPDAHRKAADREPAPMREMEDA